MLFLNIFKKNYDSNKNNFMTILTSFMLHEESSTLEIQDERQTNFSTISNLTMPDNLGLG